MSAGSGMSAKSGFIQAFGSTAEQKSRKVITGFDSDSAGVAIGFDGISDAGTTVGVSLSMSNTDVEGKGIGKAKNDMDTYTASIYMDKATDAGYVEGSLTYGMSENATSRKITQTGIARNLSGEYDSSQLSINIGAGMPMDVGTGFVTPFGSFTGTKIDTDAYLEKSSVVNDALRLNIGQDDVTSVVGTVGVKYHNVMDNGGTPMISLALNNEFGDKTIGSTNTYQGGGTAFKTSTDVEALSATLGLGYSMGNDYTSIEFAAEADANDDKYLSYGGSIKIVGKF
jgi:outer membrane autotransporter protein